MHVVFLYAALLGLLFVALSVRTLMIRKGLRISVGDNGNQVMLRASRVHANFAEYVPLSLLLLFFAETSGAPATALHLLCGALVLGRVSHAWGVSQAKENYNFRVAGMLLTFAVLIGACSYLLWGAIRG